MDPVPSYYSHANIALQKFSASFPRLYLASHLNVYVHSPISTASRLRKSRGRTDNVGMTQLFCNSLAGDTLRRKYSAPVSHTNNIRCRGIIIQTSCILLCTPGVFQVHHVQNNAPVRAWSPSAVSYPFASYTTISKCFVRSFIAHHSFVLMHTLSYRDSRNSTVYKGQRNEGGARTDISSYDVIVFCQQPKVG